jgi:hypothetical protein
MMGKGVVITLAHAGLYYARRAIINRVVSRDPILSSVRVLDVSDSIEMILPFPVEDIKYLSQSVGKSIVWEEIIVRPFAEDIDAVCTPIGRQLIHEMAEEKHINQFLML